jgi:hypothetical protein
MASKPKLIALNTGLVVGLGLIAWQGDVRWSEAQAERRASLNVPIKRVTPPPIAPVQKPEAVQATKYADVAAKNLFSKDRNPNVIVDPPKVEAPKVMPPLPVVYGVLSLPSGTRALMAEHSGAASQPIRVGDAIGPFKVLAMDSNKVTFEWDGKPIERNIDDLADHSGVAAASAAGAAAGRGSGAPPPSSGPPTAAVIGKDMGTADAPAKTCKDGDASPPGTVVDGYKKTGIVTPFGVMGCSWVPNK